MRTLTLSLAALAASAGAALAGPPVVTVTIGPELAERAEEYGQEDVARLASRLEAEVERRLAGSSRFQDARIHLVIEDARPNRPTFQQMRDRPGLSMESLSIGGAEITGQIITADGQRLPVAYDWYETSIANVTGAHTWSDANRTFTRFARHLANGSY